MNVSCMASVALLISAVSAAQTGVQCVSKARGAVFPSFAAHRVDAKRTYSRRRAILATRYDHLFQTRIRKAAKQKPNFAGHYVIATWGCGTGCAQYAIVDRVNGKVYDMPFTSVASHYPEKDEDPPWDCFADFANYKLTSRLLVIEGCLGEDGNCGRHFYVMDPSGLREIQFDPDLPLRDKQDRQ